MICAYFCPSLLVLHVFVALVHVLSRILVSLGQSFGSLRGELNLGVEVEFWTKSMP